MHKTTTHSHLKRVEWHYINEKWHPINIEEPKGDDFWEEYTYDDKGQQLTYKCSDVFWEEFTYNEAGQVLTFKNSKGCWCETTYDENGNMLTAKDSDGAWFEEELGWCIIKENIRKH